jgi:hypothetical protein
MLPQRYDSLSIRVTIALRGAILTGKLKPGDRIITSGGIYGTVMGSEEWFREITGLNGPLWFDPFKEPVALLKVSIIIGIAHVSSGLVLDIANKLRNKPRPDPLIQRRGPIAEISDNKNSLPVNLLQNQIQEIKILALVNLVKSKNNRLLVAQLLDNRKKLLSLLVMGKLIAKSTGTTIPTG